MNSITETIQKLETAIEKDKLEELLDFLKTVYIPRKLDNETSKVLWKLSQCFYVGYTQSEYSTSIYLSPLETPKIRPRASDMYRSNTPKVPRVGVINYDNRMKCKDLSNLCLPPVQFLDYSCPCDGFERCACDSVNLPGECSGTIQVSNGQSSHITLTKGQYMMYVMIKPKYLFNHCGVNSNGEVDMNLYYSNKFRETESKYGMKIDRQTIFISKDNGIPFEEKILDKLDKYVRRYVYIISGYATLKEEFKEVKQMLKKYNKEVYCK
jgi:hypothetical protein